MWCWQWSRAHAVSSAAGSDRTSSSPTSATFKIVTGYEKHTNGDTVTKAEELYGVRDVKAAERAVEELRQSARRI